MHPDIDHPLAELSVASLARSKFLLPLRPIRSAVLSTDMAFSKLDPRSREWVPSYAPEAFPRISKIHVRHFGRLVILVDRVLILQGRCDARSWSSGSVRSPQHFLVAHLHRRDLRVKADLDGLGCSLGGIRVLGARHRQRAIWGSRLRQQQQQQSRSRRNRGGGEEGLSHGSVGREQGVGWETGGRTMKRRPSRPSPLFSLCHAGQRSLYQ